MTWLKCFGSLDNISVKVKKIETPEKIAVIVLKFYQCGLELSLCHVVALKCLPVHQYICIIINFYLHSLVF